MTSNTYLGGVLLYKGRLRLRSKQGPAQVGRVIEHPPAKQQPRQVQCHHTQQRLPNQDIPVRRPVYQLEVERGCTGKPWGQQQLTSSANARNVVSQEWSTSNFLFGCLEVGSPQRTHSSISQHWGRGRADRPNNFGHGCTACMIKHWVVNQKLFRVMERLEKKR